VLTAEPAASVEDAEPEEPVEDRPPPSAARSGRRFWLLLLLPLVVGGGLRALAASTDDAITTDASAYLRSGASIWSGDGFERSGHAELHFPPLTPALLGGAADLLDDPLSGLVLVTLVTGILILVPVAGIARSIGGDRAGLAAAWIAALTPGLIAVPVNRGGGSENPFIFLVLAAVWAALGAAHRRDRWLYAGSALAGLCVGLAYLTRPEGIGYSVIALPVLVAGAVGGLDALRRRRPDPGWLRRSGLVVLAFGVAVGVCVVPYVDYLHTHTHRWELTAKTRDASLEAWRAVAEGDRRLRDEIFYDLAGDSTDFSAGRYPLTQLIKDDPGGYAALFGVNVRTAAGTLLVPADDEDAWYPTWELLPLSVTLLAAWGVWRRWRSWRLRIVLILGALALVAPLTFFVQARYLMPAAAVLCILAGVGWSEVGRRWRPWVAAALGITLLSSLYVALGGPDHFLENREQVEHRIVGEWLDEHAPEDARVMTRNLVIDFYADRQMIPMPYSSVPRMIEFARDTGTDYIVIDEYQLIRNRPQFISLFLPGPWPGLELEYEVEQDGRLTRVFSLDPPAPADGPLPEDIEFAGDEGS
jgi:hypothetical protein